MFFPGEVGVQIEMHPSFLSKKHQPVDISFTLNRYPIRNHHSVCQQTQANSDFQRRKSKIPLNYTFPNEARFQNRDSRRFTWALFYEVSRYLLDRMLTIIITMENIITIENNNKRNCQIQKRWCLIFGD